MALQLLLLLLLLLLLCRLRLLSNRLLLRCSLQRPNQMRRRRFDRQLRSNQLNQMRRRSFDTLRLPQLLQLLLLLLRGRLRLLSNRLLLRCSLQRLCNRLLLRRRNLWRLCNRLLLRRRLQLRRRLRLFSNRLLRRCRLRQRPAWDRQPGQPRPALLDSYVSVVLVHGRPLTSSQDLGSAVCMTKGAVGGARTWVSQNDYGGAFRMPRTLVRIRLGILDSRYRNGFGGLSFGETRWHTQRGHSATLSHRWESHGKRDRNDGKPTVNR